MKISKTSALFSALTAGSDSSEEIIPYIKRFLTVHPYAGLYEVDDRPYRSKVKDPKERHFHPSSDCMKCARLLYFERMKPDKLEVEVIEPRLQTIFKVGSALHAMIQAWFVEMGTLEGFPTCVENEQRIHDEDWNIGGYIDSVVRFPGSEDEIPIEIKGLAVDTEIPTPDGFSTMGELSVGDAVFGGDGTICTVVEKSPVHHKKCYRITFDDGTSVVCDHDHRWVVDFGCNSKTRREVVMTTDDMVDIGARRRSDGRRQLLVRLSDAIELPEKELPIDPYVLGVWLADGSASSGSVTEPTDSPIWAEIERRGYRIGPGTNHSAERGGCDTRTIYGIRGRLDECGVLYRKHIPSEYLRCSKLQRLDLLCGIMDGDGTYCKSRKQAMLSMTDKRMVLEVKELMESLGMKTSYCEYEGGGFGKKAAVFSVRTSGCGINPFCARNQDVELSGRRSMHRYIDSIEEVESVPTQCISVDSEDHTYLFGRSFVKTHNTINSYRFKSLSAPLPEHKMQVGCYIMEKGAPFGIVLYINKDDGEMKEFRVEPLDMMNVLMKWSSVRHAVANGDPSPLGFGCKKGSREWERCPARSFCFRCP